MEEQKKEGKAVVETSESAALMRSEGIAENTAVTDRDPTRYRHIDLPLFSGEDPIEWVFRAERYFRVNNICEDEKVDVTVVCLKERALNWF